MIPKNKGELKEFLEDMISHVTFEFNGKPCGIDPISRDNYEMWYGNDLKTAKSIDEVMSVKFFNGESINDIADNVEFDC